MSTPAQILAQLFDAGGGGADQLELSRLRGQRRGELTGQIANDRYGAAMGDRHSAADLLRKSVFLEDLDEDIAGDPYTGVGEQNRIGGIEKALTDASTYGREEMVNNRALRTRDAGQLAQSNAYGQSQGKARSDISPAGQQAQQIASRGRVVEKLAGEGAIQPGQIESALAGRMPVGPAVGQADPNQQAQVKAIIEGRTPFPGSLALSRSPELRRLFEQATVADPSFNAAKWEANTGLWRSLSSGEAGQRLRSLQTLAGHIGQLDKDRKQLGNMNNLAFMNTPAKWLNEQLFGGTLFADKPKPGEPKESKYSKFDTTQGAVITELGRLLGGAHSSDALRRMLGGEKLGSTSSDAEIVGFVNAVKDLAAKQYDAIASQAEGAPGLLDEVQRRVTPDVLQLFGRLMSPKYAPEGAEAEAAAPVVDPRTAAIERYRNRGAR